MNVILVALTAAFLTSAAFAQAPTAPTPPTPPTAPGAPKVLMPRATQSEPTTSSYCQAGTAGFIQGEASGFAGMQQCARGDTIVIPSGNANLVARVCDFTKAISTAGSSVVCVMILPERNKKG